MSANKEKVAHVAGLEYSDVLVSLWREDLDAQLQVMTATEDGPVISIPIPTTDGFFMLFDVDGYPLPMVRDDLGGWRLVVYVPEECDEEGKLAHGSIIFTSDNPDVDAMLEAVVPTVKLISSVIGR